MAITGPVGAPISKIIGILMEASAPATPSGEAPPVAATWQMRITALAEETQPSPPAERKSTSKPVLRGAHS